MFCLKDNKNHQYLFLLLRFFDELFDVINDNPVLDIAKDSNFYSFFFGGGLTSMKSYMD